MREPVQNDTLYLNKIKLDFKNLANTCDHLNAACVESSSDSASVIQAYCNTNNHMQLGRKSVSNDTYLMFTRF